MNLFTSLLQLKLFVRNKIVFSKKCSVEDSILYTIFFLRLCCCVQKQAFVGASESACYMMRKALKIPAENFIFQLRCSLQACNVDKNELVQEYFSIVLPTLQETFPSCPQIFKTFIYRISSDGCFRVLLLTKLEKILQHGSTWFLFI